MRINGPPPPSQGRGALPNGGLEYPGGAKQTPKSGYATGSHNGQRPNSLAVKQMNYTSQHSFNAQTPKNYFVQPGYNFQDDEQNQEGGQAPSEGSNYDPKRYTVAMAPASGRSPQQATPKTQHHHLQHQSHSLGRDLQGMGLITQVKKGEKVPSALPSGVPLKSKQKYHQVAQVQPADSTQVDQGGRLPLLDLMEDLPLLRPQKSDQRGKKTLVLDLDETLVHSSFKAPTGIEPPADIVLPVDIEGRICNVYVLVRPGCLKFLNEMAKYYEVVIFTASLSKYADPLMDIIDQKMVAPQRLFREHCTFSEELGVFVKDMARLGRDLKDCLIIDNSPLSYAFQPENGMPILSWYDDRTDTKLIELIPVLKLLSEVPDVRPVLSACCSRDNVYQTDKSIVMCTRIIEEINRKSLRDQISMKSPSASFTPKSPSSDSDQGKEQSVIQQEAESSPVAVLNPQTTKINNWFQKDENQAEILRDELRKASPKSNQKGLRNLNAEMSGQMQSQTAPNLVKASTHQQYISLTQNNSKQALNKSNATFLQSGNQTKMFQKLTHDQTLQIADITINAEDKTQKRNRSKKGVFNMTSNSVLALNRPKTASRDTSLTKNQPKSRAKLQMQLDVVKSPGMPIKINLASTMQQQEQGIKKDGSLSHTQIVRTAKTSSQTPNILQNKIRITNLVPKNPDGDKLKKLVVLNTGSSRIQTAQNSTRNSVERQMITNTRQAQLASIDTSLNTTHNSKSRAGSAKKRTTTFSQKEIQMISSPQTPSATKNLSKIGQGNYQSVRTSQTRQQISIETPPTKISGGSLMSRLLAATSTASGTPANKGYSSVKKTTKSPSRGQTSSKRSSSKSLISKEGKGRTPGNIFSQTLTGSAAGYANLMKNLSPSFKSMQTPQAAAKNSLGTSPQSSLNNSAVIKGTKIGSNQTAIGYLANKFDAAMNLEQPIHPMVNNILSLELVQTQASTSSKNGQHNTSHHYDRQIEISNILNDFEKTKNINKELLLMRNIGSPKQPSTHGSRQ